MEHHCLRQLFLIKPKIIPGAFTNLLFLCYKACLTDVYPIIKPSKKFWNQCVTEYALLIGLPNKPNEPLKKGCFFFWVCFLSAFDCPLFFLAKTFTQAHYWQPSIRLLLLDKWWNAVWFQAIPQSHICQCELHQKAPHKKKNREVCSLVLQIFVRTSLSCREILACFTSGEC